MFIIVLNPVVVVTEIRNVQFSVINNKNHVSKKHFGAV